MVCLNKIKINFWFNGGRIVGRGYSALKLKCKNIQDIMFYV